MTPPFKAMLFLLSQVAKEKYGLDSYFMPRNQVELKQKWGFFKVQSESGEMIRIFVDF